MYFLRRKVSFWWEKSARKMQGIDIIFVIWAMIFVFVPFLGGNEKGGGLYWAEGTLKSGKSHLPEIDEKRRVLGGEKCK